MLLSGSFFNSSAAQLKDWLSDYRVWEWQLYFLIKYFQWQNIILLWHGGPDHILSLCASQHMFLEAEQRSRYDYLVCLGQIPMPVPNIREALVKSSDCPVLPFWVYKMSIIIVCTSWNWSYIKYFKSMWHIMVMHVNYYDDCYFII